MLLILKISTSRNTRAGEADHAGDTAVVAVGEVAISQVADVEPAIERVEQVVPVQIAGLMIR